MKIEMTNSPLHGRIPGSRTGIIHEMNHKKSFNTIIYYPYIFIMFFIQFFLIKIDF
jgi:hypothetical protein